MGASIKPEFPPLLAAGFHPMSLADLRRICVTDARFSSSITRRGILDGLADLIGKLCAAGVTGEVWIDGSFLTQKIDPGDADILVHVSSDIYDNNPSVRAIVDWASDEDRLKTHACDAYRWVEYTEGHPLHSDSENDRLYWTDWYGFSRPPKKQPKGIAVVTIS